MAAAGGTTGPAARARRRAYLHVRRLDPDDRAHLPGLRPHRLDGRVGADHGVVVRAAGAAGRGGRGIRRSLGPQADHDRRRSAASGRAAAAAAGAPRRAGLDRLRGHVRRGCHPAVLRPRRAGDGPPAGAPRRTAGGQRGQRSGLERGPAGGFRAGRYHRRGRRHRRGEAHQRGQLPRFRRPAGAGRGERAHGLSRVARRTAGPGWPRSARNWPTACGGRRGTGCCGC